MACDAADAPAVTYEGAGFGGFMAGLGERAEDATPSFPAGQQPAMSPEERQRLIVEQIPHLRRYALALLRDRDRANDLVQDCLLRGLSRWHLWRGGNLRAWLFTIMHNLNANDRYRAGRAPASVPLEVAEFAAPVPPTQEDALNLAALRHLLTELPDEQRSVILLIGLEGYSYADAADMLGIPIGTVMSRLHRGRERLRRGLAGGQLWQRKRAATAREAQAPFDIAV